MKRNSLTTAVIAGLTGAVGLAATANAVNLNPDGLGQVLVYPYYTVNAGNDTLISVVNTTNRTKAVKVRFLEQYNSREVLDFNLYLSQFDVWTGAVFQLAADGPANLLTTDTSCTVPDIRTNAQLPTTPGGIRYVPFRNFQYTTPNGDNGPTNLARTRAGHLEMIEMGEVANTATNLSASTAATHSSSNNTPTNCPALVANWTPTAGAWIVNAADGISIPTGGLYGAGAIIDVANGTLLGYAADAIEGFYTNAAAPAALHAQPGTTDPSLSDANNGGGVATSFVFTSTGSLISSTWSTGTQDAVSAVYMHDAIYNEFNTEAGLGAASEWVVLFPTKRFYVDRTVARAPFTDPFPNNGSACEEIDIRYWNREENTFGTAPGTVDFSPRPPVGAPTIPALCFEANVVTFNQTLGAAGSAILGAPTGVAFNINMIDLPGTAVFDNGWMRVVFDDPLTTTGGLIPARPGTDHVLTSNDLDFFVGLPVTGFWAANYVNAGAQPGLLANYSGAFRHRASRFISAAS